MGQISRRKFVALTAAGVASGPLARMARAASGTVTAQGVFDRIKMSFGADWKPDSVDSVKAGDPATVVTGIATTSLVSLSVLDRAVRAGANLIVTCEPTFFARADSPTPPVLRFGRSGTQVPTPVPPVADPVFSAKDEFIRKHKLVVFRFSDHWRLLTPDPFVQGLAGALGWANFAVPGEPGHFAIPEISLDALVEHVKKSLQARGGMRIVGNKQLRVRKVGFLPGSTPIEKSIAMLPGVDAIIAGEVREWESVEYVRDTVALGGKKSLMLVGRIVSEGPGMQVCAEWLKGVVPEVASTWISAGDPYWRPTA